MICPSQRVQVEKVRARAGRARKMLLLYFSSRGSSLLRAIQITPLLSRSLICLCLLVGVLLLDHWNQVRPVVVIVANSKVPRGFLSSIVDRALSSITLLDKQSLNGIAWAYLPASLGILLQKMRFQSIESPPYKSTSSSFDSVLCLMWQEAEGESINMQNQIDALKEEKERLLNSLVEAEWVNKSVKRVLSLV